MVLDVLGRRPQKPRRKKINQVQLWLSQDWLIVDRATSELEHHLGHGTEVSRVSEGCLQHTHQLETNWKRPHVVHKQSWYLLSHQQVTWSRSCPGCWWSCSFSSWRTEIWGSDWSLALPKTEPRTWDKKPGPVFIKLQTPFRGTELLFIC